LMYIYDSKFFTKCQYKMEMYFKKCGFYLIFPYFLQKLAKIYRQAGKYVV
jgi:hypothetical protein